MLIKAINNIVGLDRLTPTLLVFRAYPCLTSMDTLAVLIIKRAAVIKLTMADIQKCHAVRKVLEALQMRNSPCISHLIDLLIDSKVLV